MSDVERVYVAPVSVRRRRRPPRPRRGHGFLWLAAAAVVLAGATLWYTRDRYGLQEFMPAGGAYNLVFLDLLENRSVIAGSKLWDSLADSARAHTILEILNQDLGPPDWVLNNLIGTTCVLTGDDAAGFRDAVFLTRMTRVGRLIETLHIVSFRIKSDSAGGLKLRWIPDLGVYYAIRGRLLIASPSRDALIRSLTLTAEARVDEEAFEALVARPGTEQVRGTVRFEPGDPLGAVVRSLSFALRVDSASARLSCQGVLCAEWRERAAPLLEGVSPQALLAPPEGLLEVSANLGKSLEDIFRGLGIAFRDKAIGRESQPWLDLFPEAQATNLSQLRGLAAHLGPGFRLCWEGVDLNEMIPMPEIVFLAEADSGRIESFLATLVSPPPDAKPWESYVWYDPETKQVRIPMIGGPSIEPTFGIVEKELFLSSSATVAKKLLAGETAERPLPQRGNLFIRVRPRPCTEAVVGAGRLFAEASALRGYTAQRFEEDAARWLARASTIREITGLFAFDSGSFTGEIVALCQSHDKTDVDEPSAFLPRNVRSNT